MSWLKSILDYTCPKCRKTNMFLEPFEFKKPLRMHERCTNCKQSFEPEPMFYYGAMYISYMLSSLIFLPIALTLVFGFDWKVGNTMFFIVVLGALLYYWVLRVSRSIWIHLNVRFDKNLTSKH